MPDIAPAPVETAANVPQDLRLSGENNVNEALRLIDLGPYDDAFRIIGRRLADAPDDMEAHRCLALALLRTGRFSEALVESQFLAANRPRNSAAFQLLAESYFYCLRYSEAIVTAQRALIFKPGDALVLNTLAICLSALGHRD